jgi:pimeloyl-ACP methyl ester carboxylesterase
VRVVLLHAFPLDSRMWEQQREALAAHDVVAPDLYGLGSSMEEWAGEVLERAEGEIAVVGSSMGGYCALALARLAPERLRALVLAGSRADPDTPDRRAGRAVTIELIRESGPAALWDDMRPKLFPEDADLAVLERTRELALAQSRDDLVRAVQVVRDRGDSTAVVEALECPILVATGDRDPFVPLADAEALAARARHGRLEVFHCGHLPSLERPNQFNAALTGLLS